MKKYGEKREREHKKEEKPTKKDVEEKWRQVIESLCQEQRKRMDDHAKSMRVLKVKLESFVEKQEQLQVQVSLTEDRMIYLNR